jgi:inositol-pentakisphosphate 2-kinase
MTSIRCRRATTGEKGHSVTLHYLAEGAANIVFSIRPFVPETSRTPFVFVGRRNTVYHRTVFKGCILRVSKGLDKTLTGQQVKHDFDHEIEPLFDTRTSENFLEHLLGHWMVAFDDSVFPVLNEEIKKHSSRYDGTIPAGSVGLVMEDMSPTPGRSITIEIKPKWLAQSPNAPAGARRCRTCALQAFKNHKEEQKAAYICPLQLHAGNMDIISPFCHNKVTDAYAALQEKEPTADRYGTAFNMAVYLASGKGHRLLEHLREKQVELDEHGVLAGNDPHKLRLAMTLRDCSLYVRTTHGAPNTHEEPEIEAKLGDLDFKSEAKLQDWKTKEEQLIAGGWYMDSGHVNWTYGGCLLGDTDARAVA